MLDSILICEKHTTRETTAKNAAKAIGNAWCDFPVTHIDVWCEEWFSKEFIKGFYDVCKERDNLLEAFGIRWMAHNCPGGEYDFCTNDMINQWIIEWVANKISTFTFGFTPTGYEVLVKAHRKMFQSFVESIKSETTQKETNDE